MPAQQLCDVEPPSQEGGCRGAAWPRPESRASPVLAQRADRENTVRGHRMGGRDWPS